MRGLMWERLRVRRMGGGGLGGGQGIMEDMVVDMGMVGVMAEYMVVGMEEGLVAGDMDMVMVGTSKSSVGSSWVENTFT